MRHQLPLLVRVRLQLLRRQLVLVLVLELLPLLRLGGG